MMGIHHCLYSEYLRLFHSFCHLSSSVQSYKEALVFFLALDIYESLLLEMNNAHRFLYTYHKWNQSAAQPCLLMHL